MSERRDLPLTPLEIELVELGRALAFPPPSAGFATGVSNVIAERQRRSRFGARAPFGRPLRRAVLLAIALVLVVVAVAAALGFGFPGLRIIFGGPAAPSPSATTTRPPSSGQPGSAMGLGMPVPLDAVDARVGFHVLLPPDPDLGPPDAAYALGTRVALVWGPRPRLASTLEPGVGLVISEFRGDVDRGYYEKILNRNVQVTPVTVRGGRGYWIHGDPHFFYYVDPSGEPVEDTHRAVGDTLVWASDGLTFRIESGLGMDETVRIAESLR